MDSNREYNDNLNLKLSSSSSNLEFNQSPTRPTQIKIENPEPEVETASPLSAQQPQFTMLENGISQLMQFRQAAAAHAHANAQADLLARLGRPVPRLPPLPLPFPLFGGAGVKFPQSVHPSFADHVRARFPGFPPLVMPPRPQMDPGSLQLTPVSVPDFGGTSPRHLYQDDQQLSPNGKQIIII